MHDIAKPVSASAGTAAIDWSALRRDFPILDQEVHGKPLVYLDSGASSQKPRQVIDAISHYYEHDHSNVHRGIHELSNRATAAYESARERTARFLNANDAGGDRLHARHDGVRSTSSPRRGASGTSRRATTSSSRNWSTTRT